MTKDNTADSTRELLGYLQICGLNKFELLTAQRLIAQEANKARLAEVNGVLLYQDIPRTLKDYLDRRKAQLKADKDITP